MKSVGEAMAIGRTFKESLQKALRSLETGRWGWGFDAKAPQNSSAEEITRKLAVPTAERIFWIQTAFSSGFSLDEVHQLTQIDPWFLAQMRDLAEAGGSLASLDLREAKKLGFQTARSPWRAVLRKKPCGRNASNRASSPATAWWTPAPRSSRPTRPTSTPPTGTRTKPATRAGKNPYPGRRTEPHRPGHRIRLLLRARLHGPAGNGV